MKTILWRSMLAAAAAALCAAPASAAPGFDDRDLKGEFLFVVLEVHQVVVPPASLPVVEHCVIAGTAAFDGAGTMTLNGNQRCSRTGSGAVSGTQYYAVNPDGSLLISESSSLTDPVHGQLVDHGRKLLLDGTTRTNPEIVNWSGIAMKR